MNFSRSVYWKITIPFVLIILAGMVFLGLYTARSTRNTEIVRLENHLYNEAVLISEISRQVYTAAEAPAQLDRIAKTLGTGISSRITFISANGTVLGDTDQDPAAMENHSGRPEVISAISTGKGQAIRYSATLQENMMYVAVRITDHGQVLGVSRVALPLTAVESSINSLVLTIVAAIAIVTLLVVIAAALIAALITRPVRRMTRAAEEIASGKLGNQIPSHSGDEIGRLGRAFNNMSAGLKLTVEANEREKSKLAAILASLPDGVVMADSKRNVLMSNPAAERLFNFKSAAVSGRPLIEALQDHEIENLAIKSLKTNEQQTGQLDTAGGRFLRVVAIPVNTDSSPAILVLLQDLTELRSLQTMRRELIGNISHDLRTPLAGIKVMVETLKGSAMEDKEAASDFLARIEGEVDRLSQMISEITQLSRIESGEGNFQMAPADLNAVVKDVIAEMEPLAGKQRVTLTANLEDNLPYITIDKERIQQTLINLAHNAIKFNNPGGEVIISTASEAGWIIVKVMDNGIGIYPDDLAHVFERFYKADKSRSKGGSGLGLAIAKHTVQAHGGTISADSQAGKGSIFTFKLPAGSS